LELELPRVITLKAGYEPSAERNSVRTQGHGKVMR
jgi:hypothetical protein